MSDDEADPELLALLAQSLGLGNQPSAPPTTGVLKSAEYIYDNAVDVSISSQYTKAAAEALWNQLQERNYSTQTWSQHELHPKPSGAEATVNFIFVMDLLNFSFYSDLPEDERFAVEYKGRKWTGYWSLVAAFQRALDEGHSFTTPSFYASTESCPDTLLQEIFRSCTAEPLPLLSERIHLLREAGAMLSVPENSPVALIEEANNSAARLVNLLTSILPNCFSDTSTFHGKEVRFHKRAQILVADLWACFSGTSYGEFHDIDEAITMFADYRVPQMLQSLGCLWYAPHLEARIKRKEAIPPGSNMEIEIRGCSIWCVELLKREIIRRFGGELRPVPDSSSHHVDVDQKHRPESEPKDVAGDTNASSGSAAQRSFTEDDPAQVASTLETSTPATSTGATITPEAPSQAAAASDLYTENLTSANPLPPMPLPSDTAPQHPSLPAPSNHAASPSQPPANPTPATPAMPVEVDHQHPSSDQASTEPPPSTHSPPAATRLTKVNAILVDYLLYDTCKELEQKRLAEAANHPDIGDIVDMDMGLPHHRTRSIWY